MEGDVEGGVVEVVVAQEIAVGGVVLGAELNGRGWVAFESFGAPQGIVARSISKGFAGLCVRAGGWVFVRVCVGGGVKVEKNLQQWLRRCL